MRGRTLSLSLLLAIIAAPLLVLVPAPGASAATVGDCAAEAATAPSGWHKSRYEWCKIEKLSAGERDRGGRVIGTVDALYAIAVTTNQNSQAVRVEVQVREIKSTGTLANAELSVQLPCSRCTPGVARGRTAPLASWRTDPSTAFDFTGTLGDLIGGGPDRVALHYFNPRFVLNDRLTYNARGSYFRCDQASYIARGTAGCVFPQYVPTFTFRLGGNVPLVAQHIDDALNRPASTLPSWRGKTIPSTLHRLYHDAALRRKNRSTAIATCNRNSPGYAKTTPKQDCDEYPFSATIEGAARGDDRYSARPVNASQNRSAGAQVNQWWERNRIIDGDAFTIATGK
ncbi:NucA/NucB deoxyribonuclease domain-containing protein [Frankia sp. Mgl5]|uniref:NucA/NucB deoxyribonuclease domain-containing protein n=1 Tax=Frankia sp. Mgl5 TaxID=2933793 RepID=UPI00200E42E9|nr:NucA/NucB deoxyribonuclease domain-containing protein [Frankia sp. Mgl5]MCK9928844.1 NucA/NucB deoxyribonuclease domain-containing protein [Frankia sp. Mgl5]